MDFNSGTLYTVRDSVYLSGDSSRNDVLTGTITPYVGQNVLRINEGFSGTFPPAGWTFDFSGTNYIMEQYRQLRRRVQEVHFQFLDCS